MILVAESGSTKTQWCRLTDSGIESLTNTPGINPVLMSIEEIQGVVRPVIAGIDISEVKTIYFFGAGCSGNQLKEKIGRVLFSVFNCSDMWIDSDLIGACLSLSGNSSSVVALLGTGSNSCLWDGAGIRQQTPSLGFILGDEGGGVSIGKQLVSDFLKNQMPKELHLKFRERYNLTVEIAVQRVYQSQMPNQYLAAFAPFAEANITNEYCRTLVLSQFERFFSRNLLQYENVYKLPVHFCGTIASVHQSELKTICDKFGFHIGKIEKEPINGLAKYLWSKMFGKD